MREYLRGLNPRLSPRRWVLLSGSLANLAPHVLWLAAAGVALVLDRALPEHVRRAPVVAHA